MVLLVVAVAAAVAAVHPQLFAVTRHLLGEHGLGVAARVAHEEHASGRRVVFEGVALGLVVLGLGVLLGLAEALDDGKALPRLVIASPPRLTATPATTMAAIRLTSTPAIHHAPGCCRFASERAAGDAAADAGRPCPPAMPTGAGWV